MNLLFGLIKIEFYVEDRGVLAITRYKHFLVINIFHLWNIRYTSRSPHIYSIFINDREIIPKINENLHLKSKNG